jgi:hypothetical protein
MAVLRRMVAATAEFYRRLVLERVISLTGAAFNAFVRRAGIKGHLRAGRTHRGGGMGRSSTHGYRLRVRIGRGQYWSTLPTGACRLAPSLNIKNGDIDHELRADAAAGSPLALQGPDDCITTFKSTIPGVLVLSGVDPADVTGPGIDFTACAMLPVHADGTPLCRPAPDTWRGGLSMGRERPTARTPAIPAVMDSALSGAAAGASVIFAICLTQDANADKQTRPIAFRTDGELKRRVRTQSLHQSMIGDERVLAEDGWC